jgi:hypothetical protein
LFEKTVFEDDATWFVIKAVLDSKDNKGGSTLDEEVLLFFSVLS